jgi:hypothetical protein
MPPNAGERFSLAEKFSVKSSTEITACGLSMGRPSEIFEKLLPFFLAPKD